MSDREKLQRLISELGQASQFPRQQSQRPIIVRNRAPAQAADAQPLDYTVRGSDFRNQPSESAATFQALQAAQAALAGDDSDFGQAVGGELQAIAPLARSGVLGANAIQQIVGRSVVAGLDDGRESRAASKDMQAIMQGFNTGRLDGEQVEKALDQYERTHGLAGMRVPEYQEVKGIKEQVNAARGEMLTGFAAERGVEKRYVRWDDRANAPTYNEQEIQFDMMKARLEESRSEAAAAPREMAVKVFNQKLQAVSKAIASAEAQQKDASALYRQFDKLLGEQFQAADQQIGSQPPAGSASPEPPKMEDALQTPRQPVKAPGVVPAVSRAQATADVAAGTIKVGDVRIVDGQRLILKPNGKFGLAP